MYRLNLVLMAGLSLAVVGTAVFLAVSADTADPLQIQRQELLRRLSDSDPDIAREAREEIKKMGPGAVAFLEEASSSRDELLARRADRLLSEITGSKPRAVVEAGPVEDPAPAATADRPVRVRLQAAEAEIAAGESPRLYVRLINDGPVAVKLACEKAADLVSYGRFAWFEVEAPDGRVFRVPTEVWRTEPLPPDTPVEFIVVAPGDAIDLYPGRSGGMTSFPGGLEIPGLYKIRFVYDASSESEYRKALVSSHTPAGPLPAERLVSNDVTVTVLAANR